MKLKLWTTFSDGAFPPGSVMVTEWAKNVDAVYSTPAVADAEKRWMLRWSMETD